MEQAITKQQTLSLFSDSGGCEGEINHQTESRITSSTKGCRKRQRNSSLSNEAREFYVYIDHAAGLEEECQKFEKLPIEGDEGHIIAAAAAAGAAAMANTENSVSSPKPTSTIPSFGRIDGKTLLFPMVLHYLLEQAEEYNYDEIVSWQFHGRAFCVHDPERFVTNVMPYFFQQTSFLSFKRQLALYDFRRINNKASQDYGAQFHELFLRGMPQLCHKMRRNPRKSGLNKHPPMSEEPDFSNMSIVGLKRKWAQRLERSHNSVDVKPTIDLFKGSTLPQQIHEQAAISNSLTFAQKSVDDCMERSDCHDNSTGCFRNVSYRLEASSGPSLSRQSGDFLPQKKSLYSSLTDQQQSEQQFYQPRLSKELRINDTNCIKTDDKKCLGFYMKTNDGKASNEDYIFPAKMPAINELVPLTLIATTSNEDVSGMAEFLFDVDLETSEEEESQIFASLNQNEICRSIAFDLFVEMEQKVREKISSRGDASIPRNQRQSFICALECCVQDYCNHVSFSSEYSSEIDDE